MNHRLARRVRETLSLPIAVHTAASARAVTAGIPLGQCLVELVEVGLVAERCRHTGGRPPAPAEDGEDDGP